MSQWVESETDIGYFYLVGDCRGTASICKLLGGKKWRWEANHTDGFIEMTITRSSSPRSAPPPRARYSLVFSFYVLSLFSLMAIIADYVRHLPLDSCSPS